MKQPKQFVRIHRLQIHFSIFFLCRNIYIYVCICTYARGIWRWPQSDCIKFSLKTVYHERWWWLLYNKTNVQLNLLLCFVYFSVENFSLNIFFQLLVNVLFLTWWRCLVLLRVGWLFGSVSLCNIELCIPFAQFVCVACTQNQWMERNQTGTLRR